MRETNLTATQQKYLQVIARRGTLQAGWGGYSSTLTVRILAEKGLVRLRQWKPGDWTAQLTTKGRSVVDGD